MSNSIKNISEWYLKQPQLIKATIIVTFTYLFLILFFFCIRIIMVYNSSALMEPYNRSNEFIKANIDSAKLPDITNDSYNKLFKLQNEVISLRRKHHFQVAMTFFKNYYGVTVTLILISTLGGLLLFVLINRGWTGSLYSVKVLFLSFASATIFLSLFAGVFDQQKNFENNMVRYMNYTKLEMLVAQQLTQLTKGYPKKLILNPLFDISKKRPLRIDSILVTDTTSYYRNIDSLIVTNNIMLNSYTDYILSIDASQMRSIGEVYQSLLNLKNGSAADTTKINR